MSWRRNLVHTYGYPRLYYETHPHLQEYLTALNRGP